MSAVIEDIEVSDVAIEDRLFLINTLEKALSNIFYQSVSIFIMNDEDYNLSAIICGQEKKIYFVFDEDSICFSLFPDFSDFFVVEIGSNNIFTYQNQSLKVS